MTEVDDVKQSSIISRDDLLNAIRQLPPTKSLRGKSHKEMWLHWLTNYGDPAYGRANPNRSAEYIYNAVHLPAWIVWLAAASGTSPQLLRKATGAINPTQSRQTQAAAVRRVLPWSLVAKQLALHRTTITYDEPILDLIEIYRSGEKETNKPTLIAARLGQGQFRIEVGKRWSNRCAVTGCAIPSVLRASHIKPWSKSSNRDRLNPTNGLLLAAHIDALFDCGFVSFADDGTMLVSAQLADELKQFSLPNKLQREPTKAERRFLAYHRRYVFEA
jgi:HNH endonuclease